MKEETTIKRKLENGILPYTIAADELNRSTDWKFFHGYSYSKEILPLLSGVGVTSPALGYLYQQEIPSTIPVQGLGVVGIVAAVTLGYLRVRAGRDELTKKILGQKKIIRQCKVVEFNIDIALAEDNTSEILKKLILLQQELNTIWNNGVQEEYIDPGFSNQTRQKASIKCKDLLTVHHPEWVFSEATEQTSDNIPDQK